MATVSTTVAIKGEDRSKAAFRSVQKSVGRLKKSLGTLKVGALAFGAMGVGIFALGRKSQKAADEIGKMADRLKISTKAVQVYRFAAEQAGISTGEMDKTLLELGRNIGIATTKTGAQRDAIEQLGLSSKRLAKLGFEKSFLVIADAIKDMPNRYEAMAVASDLFGRSGKKSITLFAGGAELIHRYGKELEQAGGIISEDYIRKSEAANDAGNKFSKVLSTTVSRALQGLAPATKAAADGMTALFRPSGGAGGDSSVLVSFVQVAVKGLLQLRRAFGILKISVGVFFEFMISFFKSGQAHVTRFAGLVQSVLGGAFDVVSVTVGKTLNTIIEGINSLSSMAGLEPLQLIEIEKTPSVVERINKTLADTGKLLKEEEASRKGIAKSMAAELMQVEAGHRARMKQFESSQKLVQVEQKRMNATRQAAADSALVLDQEEDRKRKAKAETAEQEKKIMEGATAVQSQLINESLSEHERERRAILKKYSDMKAEIQKVSAVRGANEEAISKQILIINKREKATLAELDEKFRQQRASIAMQEAEQRTSLQSELTQATMTEQQLEVEAIRDSYATRQGIISEALSEGLISQKDASDKIIQVKSMEAEAIKQIEQERMLASISTMTGMANAVADQGQAFFEFSKALNVGQAIMDTYRAATVALQIPPPPVGIALAAMITGLGLANVSKIASQKAPTFKREFGGPVSSGRPYLVGERGPEMFIPKSAGDIQPNAGAITVNIQVNTVDAAGFDELLFARRAVIINVINQALNRQGRQELI